MFRPLILAAALAVGGCADPFPEPAPTPPREHFAAQCRAEWVASIARQRRERGCEPTEFSHLRGAPQPGPHCAALTTAPTYYSERHIADCAQRRLGTAERSREIALGAREIYRSNPFGFGPQPIEVRIVP